MTGMVELPLVVLRSNDACFLGILRSCGIAGIPVIPVVFDWPGSGPWFSEASKYYHDPIRIPNPAADEQGAVEALASIGERLVREYGQKLLIVPSSDTNLMLLQNNFEALSPYYLYMGAVDLDAPRLDAIRKDSLASILAEAQIGIPKTVACIAPDDVDTAVSEMTYPCLYKPTHKDYVQSFQNTHNRYKAVECRTPEELRERLNQELAAGYELVVQEKLLFSRPEDESSCYIYSDADQNIRLACTAHREGEFPKPYGTGTIFRLTWIEQLLPVANAIVTALRWRGLLGIEFMRSQADGQWKVIELNARPWLFHHWQTVWGFNYIQHLHADTYGYLEPFQDTRWPTPAMLDTRPVHLDWATVVRELGRQHSTAEEFMGGLVAWMDTTEGARTFPYVDMDDPAPGLKELEYLAEHAEGPLKATLNMAQMLCRAYVASISPDGRL
jgi:predicted ATP-grasp superfamily ATP-dependent carboligase